MREAREFLRFLASSVREPQAGVGRILAVEADLLDGLPDEYVLHDHLEEVNHPVYFHQFVDHAARTGSSTSGSRMSASSGPTYGPR